MLHHVGMPLSSYRHRIFALVKMTIKIIGREP